MISENIKIVPHFYNGALLINTKCLDCGKDMNDDVHYRNAGQICDNPDGPCACGAWHKPNER